MARFAIVGGGMLGMTLALRLRNAGHDVTIYESADRCGGLAAPWTLGGITWDRHYHVTLFSDTRLRALLDELDLAREMRWVTTQTGFYVDGRMHSLSSTADFLRFPPLSLAEKARLAATILRASRITDWRPLEQVTAVSWLTAHCGRNTVEKLWLPLLRAKLGAYAERASAAFIWAIIVRMYAARRTGAKRELFGYVNGGYDRVLQRFEARLHELGVDIRTSCPVQNVAGVNGQQAVTTADAVEYFDTAIVTLAAPLAARTCADLNERERALCGGVAYQGIVCASLLTRSPLTPYYITNITDAWVPFTAVIEMSALVDRAAFAGRCLIYLPKYAPASDPVFAKSDAQIEATFLPALERMHPHFRRDDVAALRISRVPYVMPVPTVGYSLALPPMRTSAPGLYLVNSAHIVNGTLNVNETVMLAERAAREVLADARRVPAHALGAEVTA
ncbi:MAG TPA: NAD(P)/FAD-dependent oxidoreductase [Candidatus Baltobacteraceae bacterium]|jgi:protoporphyrinogen oxidase|nr:NAD(P)/FAD-dependent oxidoreductase [Candidatus Baltobacteraceae bacterium]